MFDSFDFTASIYKWIFGLFWPYVTDRERDVDPLASKPRIFNCWYKNIPVVRYSTTLYVAVQCKNAQIYVMEKLFY